MEGSLKTGEHVRAVVSRNFLLLCTFRYRFDNHSSKSDSLSMPRKTLAALLVIGCTFLAGFDLLETLNSLGYVEFAESSRGSAILHTGDLLDNNVESADQSRVDRWTLLEASDLISPSGFPSTAPRSLKLYKLQRIFLI
jgi:hypothetical protein